MIGAGPRVRAARVLVARYVAVLAVLAGLSLAHSMPCAADAMASGVAGSINGGSGDATEAVARQVAAMSDSALTHALGGRDGRAVPAPLRDVLAPGGAVDPTSGPDGPGGLLMVCLTLIVAVLAVVLALARSRLAIVIAAPTPRRRYGMRLVVPRSLSLARLCLLRT